MLRGPSRGCTPPTLVLSKNRPELLPILQGLLSHEPEIRVVLDRRRASKPILSHPERRRGSSLVLV